MRSISWSHNGLYLASTSFDGTTCIWHRKAEEPDWSVLFSLEGHENEVKCCDWSPDDAFLATCSRDKSVWIWEKIELDKPAVEVDEPEALFECASVQTEHSQDVKHVRWHPSLNILVSTSFDNSIRFYVAGEEDWYCFACISSHECTVWSVDFNPSGTRLVSVSADESIRVWQPHHFTATALASAKAFAEVCSKWTLLASLSGYHRWPIYDVSWSPVKNYFATVGADNSIHIFSELESPSEDGPVRYRQVGYRKQAHQQDINSVHWNPANQSLVTGSDDSRIRIWRI